MKTYISTKTNINQMTNVLISTIYEKWKSIVLSVGDYNIKKIILLKDKEYLNREKEEKQTKSIEQIKKMYSGILPPIKEVKIDLFDISSITKEVEKVIDNIPKTDEIYVDISQSMRPQMLGVLFACYKKSDRVSRINYWHGEEEKPIVIPKLSIKVNETKKKILKLVEKSENLSSLSVKLGISRTILYKHLNDLEKKGYLIKDNGKYKVTEAGKIVLV